MSDLNESVYGRITQEILKRLEKGVVPWHQSWKKGPEGFPKNLVSQRRYRGINVFLLSSQGYQSPFWLTLQQANQLDGKVKKGEKATPVIFWKWNDKEIEVREQERSVGVARDKKVVKVPVIRFYHLFNVEQCQGIEYPRTAPNPNLNPMDEADRIVDGYPNPPRIDFQGDKACYLPQEDAIRMPELNRFEKMEEYYSTLFHELIHSTGHDRRLNRSTLIELCPFGSTNYSKEELVAEMGAAMLCGECGIEQAVMDNSASYIAGWLKRLQNDSHLVVLAAGKAQQAADYILGRQFQVEESETEKSQVAQ